MDSTNPDLSYLHARRQAHRAENTVRLCAEPMPGIAHVDRVVQHGGRVNEFPAPVSTAPGVDHVGAGALGNVDLLAALTAGGARPCAGRAAAGGTGDEAPFAVKRAPRRANGPGTLPSTRRDVQRGVQLPNGKMDDMAPQKPHLDRARHDHLRRRDQSRKGYHLSQFCMSLDEGREPQRASRPMSAPIWTNGR